MWASRNNLKGLDFEKYSVAKLRKPALGWPSSLSSWLMCSNVFHSSVLKAFLCKHVTSLSLLYPKPSHTAYFLPFKWSAHREGWSLVSPGAITNVALLCGQSPCWEQPLNDTWYGKMMDFGMHSFGSCLPGLLNLRSLSRNMCSSLMLCRFHVPNADSRTEVISGSENE